MSRDPSAPELMDDDPIVCDRAWWDAVEAKHADMLSDRAGDETGVFSPARRTPMATQPVTLMTLATLATLTTTITLAALTTLAPSPPSSPPRPPSPPLAGVATFAVLAALTQGLRSNVI